MLTRALLILALICGLSGAAFAEDAKVLALGLADHEAMEAELQGAAPPPVPRFNTPAIAYALLANLKKGDSVEVSLNNGDKPLLTNSATLEEDKATFLLEAGKRGVPAGGWPSEWKYSATVKVTRDGKVLIEQASAPIPFE
jgi:hypothetical protein